MANELTVGAEITIVQQSDMNMYSANKKAMDRIKTLSDSDFEKEISELDCDTQFFLRIARER